MVQTRTDGQLAVPTETMPTEQANVQLPTAEGEVGQQTKAHQIREFVNEVNALNPRSVYWKQSLLEFAPPILAASLIALVGIGVYTVKQFVDKTTRKEGDGNE